MTEDEQVAEIKLALAGIGIWCYKEHVRAEDRDPNVDRYAVVHLGSEYAGGDYYYKDTGGMELFKTRTQAIEYAFKRLGVST